MSSDLKTIYSQQERFALALRRQSELSLVLFVFLFPANTIVSIPYIPF